MREIDPSAARLRTAVAESGALLIPLEITCSAIGQVVPPRSGIVLRLSIGCVR
jgi:hypothetical protein